MTSSPSNCRPISLIYSYVKISTKDLATRLKPFLNTLIDPTQIVFIKGRTILDNILYAYKVIHQSKRDSEANLICKFNFSKAFDKVNQDYLLNILEFRGFPSKWKGWIRNLLLSSKVVVCLNGDNQIPHRRSFRQGDLLFPYLFIIASNTYCDVERRVLLVLH